MTDGTPLAREIGITHIYVPAMHEFQQLDALPAPTICIAADVIFIVVVESAFPVHRDVILPACPRLRRFVKEQEGRQLSLWGHTFPYIALTPPNPYLFASIVLGVYGCVCSKCSRAALTVRRDKLQELAEYLGMETRHDEWSHDWNHEQVIGDFMDP
jgi:hypothetical protein